MFCPSLPVMPFEKTSVMKRWLSVPLETMRKPVSRTASHSAFAFFTICP
jgi:hypothetical protein